MRRRGRSGIELWAVAVPALAVVAILLIALTTGLLLAGYVLSGAAGFVSGGVFAYLATLPRRRRRLVAGLLVLTSVLAMVAGFVALFSRIPPPSLYDVEAGLGSFAFWFAFGTLNVALLRRRSTAGGQDAGG